MSTSPSWFDQEKLSRLVKKVGTKTVTELPHVQSVDPEHRPASEGLASTARISLVSKPPSLLSDQRALPALPRRTSNLPNVKSLFPGSNPPVAPEPPPAGDHAASESAPDVPHPKDEHAEDFPESTSVIPSGQEGDLSEIWHKMSLLNEELARTVLERDQAQNEGALLREQLNRADEEQKEAEESSAAPTEELARLTKERDDAIAQLQGMRAQLLLAKDAEKEKASVPLGDTQEITIVTGERDQARRQYADLRKQFETLKQEQAPKEETVKYRKEWEQQLEELKQKVEERDKEIAALKASSAAAGSGDEKLKQEVTSLRDQLTRVKDEASVAQRGLALSQKALQQTRDTLREATEGTSLSRHNFDNLKNECAILAQQNTVLQGQIDQLSRDLKTTKSKTTRLQ
jgi:chromosome segregation ATPase